MIELPRAALRADEIAKHAAFFSFGTNDLTQMTLGLSRDDSGKFLDAYLKAEHLRRPTRSRRLDQTGVGELVEHRGRARPRQPRADLKLGICGEHGGDPASVAFCDRAGLDYVSCSPYRVPIARLAAAQAALQGQGGALSPATALAGLRGGGKAALARALARLEAAPRPRRPWPSSMPPGLRRAATSSASPARPASASRPWSRPWCGHGGPARRPSA